VIVRVEPLFEAIKWAGVAYLVFLGAQAVRSAIRGEYPSLGDDAADRRASGVLTRRRVRRGLDAATGTALLGFSARLAAEH
jgi:threonine/homoserine/homoserine lactone efflux protein